MKPIRLLRWLITLGLLGYVVMRSGLLAPESRDAFLQTFSNVHVWFLVAALLIPIPLNFSSALKWHMLLQARGGSPGVWRLFAYYMIGQFYNMLLPTSMGGDIVRIHELARVTGRRAEAVASVFVERFTGFITLIVIALAAVLVNLRIFNDPLITISLGAFSALILAVGWLVLDPRLLALARKLVASRIHALGSIFDKLEKIQSAVSETSSDKRAMAWAGLNSLLFYMLAILNVWLSVRTFSPDFSLLSALVATPVIMLIMNLPISIGNIGLLEFACVFTLELLGFPSALGVSAAILIRFKSLMDAGFGAALHPLVSKGRSIKQEIREETEEAGD